MISCLSIGLIAGYFFPDQNQERQRGLVWGTIKDAIRNYKGSDGSESFSQWVLGAPVLGNDEEERDLPVVWISPYLAQELEAQKGDLLYVSDPRKWLGGLRSTHAIIGGVKESLSKEELEVTPYIMEEIARPNHPLRIKRMY